MIAESGRCGSINPGDLTTSWTVPPSMSWIRISPMPRTDPSIAVCIIRGASPGGFWVGGGRSQVRPRLPDIGRGRSGCSGGAGGGAGSPLGCLLRHGRTHPRSSAWVADWSWPWPVGGVSHLPPRWRYRSGCRKYTSAWCRPGECITGLPRLIDPDDAPDLFSCRADRWGFSAHARSASSTDWPLKAIPPSRSRPWLRQNARDECGSEETWLHALDRWRAQLLDQPGEHPDVQERDPLDRRIEPGRRTGPLRGRRPSKRSPNWRCPSRRANLSSRSSCAAGKRTIRTLTVALASLTVRLPSRGACLSSASRARRLGSAVGEVQHGCTADRRLDHDMQQVEIRAAASASRIALSAVATISDDRKQRVGACDQLDRPVGASPRQRSGGQASRIRPLLETGRSNNHRTPWTPRLPSTSARISRAGVVSATRR